MKKWFSHLSSYEMFVCPLLYGLPFTLISLLFIKLPPLDDIFFLCFAVSLPLNAVPFILYMEAIKISPLSLTVPYLAFTPVFMIGTGSLLLNEIPDLWGIAGITAVCIGSYVLNLDFKRPSLLGPFRAIRKETGSWLMLIVAFIFSFSSVIGKLAIIHSSVMFFQMSFFTALGLVSVLILILLRKIDLKALAEAPGRGMVAGALLFLHILFHGFAISMTKAAYMISVKRLSVVFGVVYGGVLFDEKNILVRFFGALLMFSGAALILLKAR